MSANLKKILVVEDNPQNMRLVEMTLGAGNYVLLKATNGEEALEVVQREHPNLIIMDIRLPRLDGLEVTKRVRQWPDFRDVAIVVTTACAMKGDKERFVAAGCDAYLAKPFSIRALRKIIDGILREKKSK